MTVLGVSELNVFPVCLGGNTFGWTSDTQASFEVMDAYVEAGGNFIDTSDSYSAWVPGHSGGESEAVIGEWLASRGNRDSVIVATKCSRHPDYQGLAPQTIVGAAEQSLKRLGTDRIDLYWAHYDDPDTPLADTIAAFDTLIREGKVRYWALSNYSAERIEEAIVIADAGDWAKPVALQPHYNLVARKPYEDTLAPVAAEYALGVTPYFALAAGFLSGKYHSRDDLAGQARGPMAGRYFSPEGLAVLGVVEEIAAARGVTPPTVAIAWLLTRPDVVSPIASASRLEQLPALVAAASFTLAGDEVARLNAVSANVPAA